MSTRERKSKINAESPTPTSGSDSAPTTPTTNTTAAATATGGTIKIIRKPPVRGRTTRGSNAQQQVAADIEPINQHDTDGIKEKEDASGLTTATANQETNVSEVTKVPRTPRGTRLVAAEVKTDKVEADEEDEAESAEGEQGEEDQEMEVEEEKTTTSPTSKKKITTPIKRTMNTRKGTLEGVKKVTILKRKSLPITRSGKMVTRRNSTGKMEVAITKAIKEEIITRRTPTRQKKKQIQAETTPKKRKNVTSEVKADDSKEADKRPEKIIKLEKAESIVSDSEVIRSRRRSDSVSKCSDTTDNSSFYDVPHFKEPEDSASVISRDGDEIKTELVDIEEETSISTKVTPERANKQSDSAVEDSDSSQPSQSNQSTPNQQKLDAPKAIRRSGRPRKSTLKDKDMEMPATKMKVVEIKTEVEGTDAVINFVENSTVANHNSKVVATEAAPLHIETTSKTPPPLAEKQETEKASSLSPELVSEGVSAISVQQFYGQPAFLENNLGIEEDPNLGEIVQVQEKNKLTDKVIISPNEVIESEKENLVGIVKEIIGVPKIEKVDEKPEGDDVVTGEILNGPTVLKENQVNKEAIGDEITEGKIKVKTKESSKIDSDKLKISEPLIENIKHENETKQPLGDVNAEPDGEKEDESNIIIKDGIDDNVENSEDSFVDIEGHVPESTNCELDNKDNMEVDNQELSKSEFKDELGDNKAFELVESPETRLKKESHLKSLGLLTHEEANIEKQRRREFIKTSSGSSSSSSSSTSSNGSKHGKSQKGQEYTGTLKTVIKLHRPNAQEKRKTRMPLKMTFQKGRGKGSTTTVLGCDRDSNAVCHSDEDTYYTIQNEIEPATTDAAHGGQNRKAHNRSHTADVPIAVESIEPVKETEKALVIPEKASSFSIHPGRLCQDQCYYCGGKFGLFDTPCHVAQIKSLERQKKILDNEEKLTVDNCLCDACYRHVDRRANCPSYKSKRISAPPLMSQYSNSGNNSMDIQQNSSYSADDSSKPITMCLVTNCDEIASHSLRRKWFSKMRKSINKFIKLNVDVSNATGQGQVPICDKHYDIISHLMVCALCKRKLPRNHIFYITQEINRLEQLLESQGIPVILGSTPVVCKLCRYYANLLLKPPEGKTQKAQFVKNYRRRLLTFHNVEIMEDSDSELQNGANRKGTKHQQQHKPNVTVKRIRKSDEDEDNEQMKHDYNDGHQTIPAGQIMLDNDVMVDYDAPIIDTMPTVSHKHKQKLQSLLIPRNQIHAKQRQQQKEISNEISKVLRGNPNISMRELFPGEEEMGLQVHIPFGQGGQRTPEGWTRVQNTLQYDDATKHLWDHLQKPYGNQSSFLRHLILLEKYFRNGDLILSQTASYNAMSYSESVQNRLRAFDNVSSENLSILQQLSNSTITITPTISKPKINKSGDGLNNSSGCGGGSTSLLKSNNQVSGRKLGSMSGKNDSSIELFATSAKSSKQDQDSGVSITKKQGIPPELISINTTKSGSSPMSVQIIPTGSQTQQHQRKLSPPATVTSSPERSSSKGTPPNVVKLPEVLTAIERRQTNGKPWRPTLMPITQNNLASMSGPLYQTADGRLLPSKVQVMSGGKPYHISIYDYNRMCIMRRENLLQQQLQKQKVAAAQIKTANIGNHQNEKASSASAVGVSANKGKVQIPNKILEQNSVIPINKSSSSSSASIPATTASSSFASTSLSAATLTSDAQSLIKVRKNNPTSLLKNHQMIQIAPKPLQIPNCTSVVGMSQTPTISAVLSLAPGTSGASTSSTAGPISISSIESLFKNAAVWSWNENAMNGSNNGQSINVGGNGGGVSGNCSNVLSIVDNSAASVLSKIPKSLTVIPQQKGRSTSRVSSSEDQTSA